MKSRKMGMRLSPWWLAMAGLLGTGCGGSYVEVGPIRLTSEVGQGTLIKDLFTPKAGVPITNQDNFCNMPSESDLEQQYLQIAGVDLSQFVRLTHLNLVQTKLTATSGDFNFLDSITVSYIPAPVNGQPQDPVVLGSASNANGLGTEVTLVPPAQVDFLDLIQENDANPSSQCPKLEERVTARSVPTQDVSYTVSVTIDAYAEVGSP